MTLICENWKSQVSVHGAWCKCLVSVHDWMVQCIAAWWATIAIGALVAIGGIGALGMMGHHWWCMAIDYVKSS